MLPMFLFAVVAIWGGGAINEGLLPLPDAPVSKTGVEVTEQSFEDVR